MIAQNGAPLRDVFARNLPATRAFKGYPEIILIIILSDNLSTVPPKQVSNFMLKCWLNHYSFTFVGCMCHSFFIGWPPLVRSVEVFSL